MNLYTFRATNNYFFLIIFGIELGPVPEYKVRSL